MVSILQVYVPFKLNFIQHILFRPITTKAINFFFYLCFCFYRIPLVHPLANRGNAASFSSLMEYKNIAAKVPSASHQFAIFYWNRNSTRFFLIDEFISRSPLIPQEVQWRKRTQSLKSKKIRFFNYYRVLRLDFRAYK